MTSTRTIERGWRSRLQRAQEPLGCYFGSTLVVLVGSLLGADLIKLPPGASARPARFSETLARGDGRSYCDILSHGYYYDHRYRSNVAFFPLFPLLGRAVHRATGLSPACSLIVVSHASIIAAFAAIGMYVRRTRPDRSAQLAVNCMLAMGLLPTALFFRFAYSESVFVLLAIIALYFVESGRSLSVAALVAGTATAARPVGVALLVPLLDRARRESSLSTFAVRAAWLTPLATWGLVSYSLFQWMSFGDPFAFAKTQAHYDQRPLGDRTSIGTVRSALTMSPILNVYNPESHGYWGKHAPFDSPLFNLHFADPIWFLVSCGLLAGGWMAGGITRAETLLGVSLLALSYALRGPQGYMTSAARFTAVAFPIYIVLGELVCRAPTGLLVCAAAACGFLLGAYSAMFAAGYEFI